MEEKRVDTKTEQEYLTLAKESLDKFTEMDKKISKRDAKITELFKVICMNYSMIRFIDEALDRLLMFENHIDNDLGFIKMSIERLRNLNSDIITEQKCRVCSETYEDNTDDEDEV
mgnify:FL=1